MSIPKPAFIVSLVLTIWCKLWFTPIRNLVYGRVYTASLDKCATRMLHTVLPRDVKWTCKVLRSFLPAELLSVLLRIKMVLLLELRLRRLLMQLVLIQTLLLLLAWLDRVRGKSPVRLQMLHSVLLRLVGALVQRCFLVILHVVEILILAHFVLRTMWIKLGDVSVGDLCLVWVLPVLTVSVRLGHPSLLHFLNLISSVCVILILTETGI